MKAILERDTATTREFLYRTCYPLFKSIYDKYYTDCENLYEFINEIYVFIMLPGVKTGRSKLAAFGFRSTLTSWLKVVTENFCHQLYDRRIEFDTNSDVANDRFSPSEDSLTESTRELDMADLHKILGMMKNQRFRRLIECIYLEDKSPEETAEILGVTKDNYYNMHKRAKAQFCDMLRKEGLL